MAVKYVVIGDIIRSKELKPDEREKLQENLQDELGRINKESDGLISPHTITLGDEFQAVYQSADSILIDSWKLLEAIYPVKIRFSICAGSITTPVNKKQAIGMDGPAFHMAREGIELLKRTGDMFIVSAENSSDLMISFVNDAFRMISKEMKRWNKTRFQILNMLATDLPVKEIAKKMGISESAVYKNRNEGGLDIILSMEKTIRKILNNEI